MKKKPEADPVLDRLRAGIDGIDRRLLELLSKRGALVEKVGRHKKKNGATRFHRPERERAVVEKLVAANRGPYPDEAIESFWREVMSASLALESPLTISAADEDAAKAARRRFGSAARLTRASTVADVVDAVARGFAGYGVIAVEDSASGFRGAALDALGEGDALVTGEIAVSADGVTTRSLVIGGDEPRATGDDQTSAVLVPRDEPGAIAHVLEAFGRRGVNLRRIEARPARAGARRARAKWDYQFFVDLEGHREDPALKRALRDLAKGGALVRVLGSYPRARLR